MKSWTYILLKRDLLIAFRRSATYITPLIFFLIVITFFPLALGPQQKLLSSLAPGVIWIAALLASLLAVETIFNEDFRDGSNGVGVYNNAGGGTVAHTREDATTN